MHAPHEFVHSVLSGAWGAREERAGVSPLSLSKLRAVARDLQRLRSRPGVLPGGDLSGVGAAGHEATGRRALPAHAAWCDEACGAATSLAAAASRLGHDRRAAKSDASPLFGGRG